MIAGARGWSSNSAALNVFLVRHGETDHNREGRLQGQRGVPLNETGRMQAAGLALFLKEVRLQAIYSSDVKRAFETASIISPLQCCPTITLNGLREWDFGAWEGLTFAEILKYDGGRRAAWMADPVNTPPPGGESLIEARNRGMAAIKHIVGLHPSGSVAVVSHGALIRAVITTCSGRPLEDALTLRVGLGTLSVLEFQEGSCTVEVVGLKPRVSGENDSPEFRVAGDDASRFTGNTVYQVLFKDKEDRC